MIEAQSTKSTLNGALATGLDTAANAPWLPLVLRRRSRFCRQPQSLEQQEVENYCRNDDSDQRENVCVFACSIARARTIFSERAFDSLGDHVRIAAVGLEFVATPGECAHHVAVFIDAAWRQVADDAFYVA